MQLNKNIDGNRAEKKLSRYTLSYYIFFFLKHIFELHMNIVMCMYKLLKIKLNLLYNIRLVSSINNSNVVSGK